LVACACFETSGLRGFSEDLGEFPRHVLGFSLRRVDLYFVLYLSLYSYFVLGGTLVLVCGRVPNSVHVLCLRQMVVLGYFIFCTYVISVMFFYCFIPCVADPSRSFSLRALYSASGLHHSTV